MNLVTLIGVENALRSIQVFERTLNDNYTIYYVEDGTLDMGSSFDIFDEVSHFNNSYIFDDHKQQRQYLKTVMESVGFVAYDLEWWHFRLRVEPFPDTFFDFEMYESNNEGILIRPGTVLVSILVLSLVIFFLE